MSLRLSSSFHLVLGNNSFYRLVVDNKYTQSPLTWTKKKITWKIYGNTNNTKIFFLYTYIVFQIHCVCFNIYFHVILKTNAAFCFEYLFRSRWEICNVNVKLVVCGFIDEIISYFIVFKFRREYWNEQK